MAAALGMWLSFRAPLAASQQAAGRQTTAPAAPAPAQSGGAIAGLPRRATPNGPPTTPPFWWTVDTVKRELGLSDDKAGKIDDIYQKRQKLMAPLAAEFDRESKALDKMTADRTADDSTYSLQVRRVESLRSQLNESRLMMLYRMYRELTPDQYRKLQEISERMFHDDRGRGPGPGTGGGR